jgi:threonine dehydrogenase-like Zn-dependent dehydrogenase
MALYKGYGNIRGGFDKEYQVFNKETDLFRYPVTLGNMCVGEVIKVGSGVTLLREGDIVFNFGAEAHFNRPRIIFSRACSEPNPDYPNWNEARLFEVAWRLLSNGAIKSEPVVHPIVDFDDLLTEYPKIDTNPGENIKLGVRFVSR